MFELYHGSPDIIKKPEFGKGKPYNDYGLGFYCTESAEMACEWAVGSGRGGYANHYRFDTEGLECLDLNGPDYTILHWLALLLQNREFDVSSLLAREARDYLIANFEVPYLQADYITGYRADDSYFSFAQDFLNGSISVRQLGNAMKLGKLGTQVVLKSRRAFEQIEFIDASYADNAVWYPRRMMRDKAARRQYFDAERSGRQKGDLFILQILDGEVKADDDRLR